MAADTLSLRERIAQALVPLDPEWKAVTVPEIIKAILPVVEQEIQQEQEKAEYFLRRASEQHERDAAALADHNTRIDKLDAIRLRWEVLTTSTPWLIAALGYARAYTAFNSDRTVDADPADMIRWLLNRSDLYGSERDRANAAESALAEKDAALPIRLYERLTTKGRPWAQSDAATVRDLVSEILRETPAPQEPKETP